MCTCLRMRTYAQLSLPVQLFATPWTIAHQVPLPMEFSRQEYWSGLPFPKPVDLPNPGLEPVSLVSSTLAGGFLTTAPPESKPLSFLKHSKRCECTLSL